MARARRGYRTVYRYDTSMHSPIERYISYLSDFYADRTFREITVWFGISGEILDTPAHISLGIDVLNSSPIVFWYRGFSCNKDRKVRQDFEQSWDWNLRNKRFYWTYPLLELKNKSLCRVVERSFTCNKNRKKKYVNNVQTFFNKRLAYCCMNA